MHRRRFLAVVSTAVAGVAGCLQFERFDRERVGDEGGGEVGTPAATRTTAVPADRLIEIRNDAFDPKVAEVAVGSLVRWANHDPHDHEVTSGQFSEGATPWEYTSDVLGERDIAATTFDEAGVYEYYCSIVGKEVACGVVLVGDVDAPEELPCGGLG